jgi:hypothetical protein
MSSFFNPTCSRIFGIANIGAIPMYLGSQPWYVRQEIRAHAREENLAND